MGLTDKWNQSILKLLSEIRIFDEEGSVVWLLSLAAALFIKHCLFCLTFFKYCQIKVGLTDKRNQSILKLPVLFNFIQFSVLIFSGSV